MTRDSGAVLINALVVVLAIAAVSTALLVRSEGARMRATEGRDSQQQALYLDAAELLVPDFLDEVVRDSIAHPEQTWGQSDLGFPIDRGRVGLRFTDLQGRLNVNWLTRSDDYVDGLFRAVFADAGVSQAFVVEIGAFVSADGPPKGAYLARRPSVLPRGGRITVLEDLLELDGMSPEVLRLLKPYLAALPTDSRLNLNTAPDVIKRAALLPLPEELVTEVLAQDGPIGSISELRGRTTEILETEDLDHLPFERLTTSSNWFAADIVAETEGRVDRRRAIYRLEPVEEIPVIRVLGWAVFN